MLEDRDLRQIREIVAREVADALREQLPRIIGDTVSNNDLKYALNALEDRIVKRLE